MKKKTETDSSESIPVAKNEQTKTTINSSNQEKNIKTSKSKKSTRLTIKIPTKKISSLKNSSNRKGNLKDDRNYDTPSEEDATLSDNDDESVNTIMITKKLSVRKGPLKHPSIGIFISLSTEEDRSSMNDNTLNNEMFLSFTQISQEHYPYIMSNFLHNLKI